MTINDNPRVCIPPPLIFSGLVAFGLFLDGKTIALGPLPVIGSTLGIAGVALIAIAVGLFRSSDTRPEPWQPASVLVNRGLYRITRNPMYLGMAMLSLGVALLFLSVAGSALAIIATIVIDRTVIPREEAYLMRRFGQHYENYARGVRRWL